MKNIISSTLLLFFTTHVFSQQDILKHVNSYYMKPEGYFTNYLAVNNLNSSIPKRYYGSDYSDWIEELSPNSAYFSMRYPSKDPGEAGLLYISWLAKTTSLSSASIEDLTTNLFETLTVDEDINTRVIKYIKNNTVHAGYMYNSAHNSIYFVILSLDKREMVRGSVSINLATNELKEAFITTFINNLRFEPYTPSRVNPEGSGGRGGSRG